jgi:hypothetical protein
VSENEKQHESRNSPSGAWGELRALPWLVKLWLLGYAVIYLSAKVHTYVTVGSPGFVASHWPFWAALLGWPALLVLAGLVVPAIRKWCSDASIAGNASRGPDRES